MYFPILRGRQFELLALRECVNKNLLSNKIIPIVEPVKVSSTYTKTVDSFIKAGKPIAVIRNPQVGSWIKDLKKESNAKIREQASEQLKDANVISSFYVTSSYRCSETNQFDVSTIYGNGNCRYINGIHKPGKAITY